jgi:hypothetical protein
MNLTRQDEFGNWAGLPALRGAASAQRIAWSPVSQSLYQDSRAHEIHFSLNLGTSLGSGEKLNSSPSHDQINYENDEQ